MCHLSSLIVCYYTCHAEESAEILSVGGVMESAEGEMVSEGE